ncbi:MAG: PA0069 family radical SAM protein [Bacteroidia bacterium]|nr:PA0069 family radical SAM protein [Bacteroidia bacterium]
MQSPQEYLRGRGAQLNTSNPFLKASYETGDTEGLDEPWEHPAKTQVFMEHPKNILNPIKSPDVPGDFSLNPYQGCEHGCIYCYARNSHQYAGFSAGLDFESKIVVKVNAAQRLEETFRRKNWKPSPIMFSGNTDCYQPLERKYEITRQCLEVFDKFSHPVGLITKNSLIERDIDILQRLASRGLVHVRLTVTTLNEELRRNMEPRTASGRKRMETVRRLTEAGIPTGVMLGPIIPGLNQHETPDILQACADAGAVNAGYTYIRLNGAVGEIFENWIRKVYPDRAEKVLGQIKQAHGGQLNDSRFGTRMKGEGELAEGFSRFFKLLHKKIFADRSMPAYNLEAFRLPEDGQLSLF